MPGADRHGGKGNPDMLHKSEGRKSWASKSGFLHLGMSIFGRGGTGDMVLVPRLKAQAFVTAFVGMLFLTISAVLRGRMLPQESAARSNTDKGLRAPREAVGLSPLEDKVCTATGRTFAYWEPCLPEHFPGCKPCSADYSIKELSTVFETARTEWAIYGKTEPWWSVLTDDRWKGKTDIPDKIKDEFYDSDIGAVLIDELLKNYSDPGKQMMRNSALDFGCGVGRTTFGLHQKLRFKRVVGVDQSVWHLEVARKEAKRKGIDQNVEFVVSNPDMLAALQCEKFDFAYSMIALQHMVPPLIITYIEQICDSLKIGGRGFFQVPTKLLADYSQFKCSFEWAMHHAVHEGGMQVWSVSEALVSAALNRRGCQPKFIFDLDAIGIPGSESKAFFFSKEKDM